ncbi:DUF3873 family protein, partial [uncultured Duncaniella sp.]|uniref:DUF3873 family protein n=1 Tax=uncultured Duncaniella sp. TaxID=2768039 RepID=UPI003467E905
MCFQLSEHRLKPPAPCAERVGEVCNDNFFLFHSISCCQEQYETFYSTHRGKPISRVMYGYRTEDGELFSVVAPTLKECRQKRDEWLAKK